MTIISRTTFIFDIDSTILNNDHRAGLLTKHCKQCGALVEETAHRAVCKVCGCDSHHIPQKCWDEFLAPELLLKDTVYPDALRLINHLRERDMAFHFITGRGERLREPTEQWLTENIGWPGSQKWNEILYMRPESGDSIPASVIKERLLMQLCQDFKLNPVLDKFIFFEDDSHVFGMYQKYGVVVRCPDGLQHFCPPWDTSKEPGWKR